MERQSVGPTDRRIAQRIGILLALAACAALLGVGLGDRELKGDEAIYVTIAHRAADAGRWAPLPAGRSNYVDKPPLAIWSIGIGTSLFGEGEAGQRAAAAFASFFLCLVTLGLGSRLASPAVGATSALLLVTAPNLLHDHGLRAAVTEPLLLLEIVGSFWLVVAATGRRRLAGLAAISVASGLTKGVYGPVVVSGTLALAGTLGAWRGSRDGTFRASGFLESLASATAALLPGLAAYLAWLRLSLDSWGGVAAFLRRDLLQRVATGVDPAHLNPPSLYWRTVTLDFGVLLALAVVAIVAGLGFERRTEAGADGRSLLFSWVLVVSALALGSSSRLPWYFYPAYPALALGAAVAMRGLALLARGRQGLGVLLAAGLALAAAARARTLSATWPAPAPRSLAALVRLAERAPEVRLFVDARLLARGAGAPRLRQWHALYLRRFEAVAPGELPESGAACRFLVTGEPEAWQPVLEIEAPPRVELPRASPADASLVVFDLCGGRWARGE